MASRRKKKSRGETPRGLEPQDVTRDISKEAQKLAAQIEKDGGQALCSFREPFGGKSVVLAALPLSSVEPTPFQRDLSAPHVERLANVMEKIGRFLDPVIAVRREGGGYWTPNGNHRLHALKLHAAKSIIALVIPEPEVAFQILALNTERAHNLKEKSLEVIRMARALATDSDRKEADFAFEFEDPAFLTLGSAYEKRARLAGSSYQPVIRRLDAFREEKLPKALQYRESIATVILELDEVVNDVIAKLKARGFQSPYLKSFVVARINPLRFQKTVKDANLQDVLASMVQKARRMDANKIKESDVQSAGGPPAAEE